MAIPSFPDSIISPVRRFGIAIRMVADFAADFMADFPLTVFAGSKRLQRIRILRSWPPLRDDGPAQSTPRRRPERFPSPAGGSIRRRGRESVRSPKASASRFMFPPTVSRIRMLPNGMGVPESMFPPTVSRIRMLPNGMGAPKSMFHPIISRIRMRRPRSDAYESAK